MMADDTCITCGDVAVTLEVVTVHGTDATCRAPDGGEELVAIDLVPDVHPGDHLLVHAKVALEKVPPSGRYPYQGGIRLAGRDRSRPDVGAGA